MEHQYTAFRREAQRKYAEDSLFKARVDEAAALVAASFAFPTSSEQFMVACLAYERIASLPQEPVDTRKIVVDSIVRVAAGAEFTTWSGRHPSTIPAPCLATVKDVPGGFDGDNYTVTVDGQGWTQFSVLPEYVSLVQ